MVTGEQKVQAQDIILSGQKIHFWTGGTGFPLLLMHSAWGDAAMSWANVWDELSCSFTVVAPDLPGFGQSSQISGPSLPAMAKVLRELLDALDIGRAVVAGNSFGAGVARQFTGDFQETVSRLILVNGGYMPHLPAPLRKLIAVPFFNRKVRRLMSRLSFSPQALRKSFVNSDKLPAGFFERIREDAPAYSDIVFETFMNLSRKLPVPDAPTFLIWGAQDGLSPVKQAKALQKKIPGSLLISLDGAGHMPQREKPREFVMAFMSAAKHAE